MDHVYNGAVQQPDYGCVQFLSSICCPQARVVKVDWQLYAIDNCCSTSFWAVLKSLSVPWLQVLSCHVAKQKTTVKDSWVSERGRQEERRGRTGGRENWLIEQPCLVPRETLASEQRQWWALFPSLPLSPFERWSLSMSGRHLFPVTHTLPE